MTDLLKKEINVDLNIILDERGVRVMTRDNVSTEMVVYLLKAVLDAVEGNKPYYIEGDAPYNQ